MTIKRKDFQKAAALVHEFLLKLTDDTDCAELRDALNLALLHMQRYYRSLRNKLQSQDKREGNTLNLSIRGLSPMTPFKDAPDKFQWKWINLDNPRLSNTLELTKELSTLPQACVAAKEGETDRLVQLIEDDPDVVIETDGVGRTALAYAVHFGHLEALQQLLEHGADPNATANDGTTAVHRACHDGKHEALQILIEYNADLSIQDVQGRAPIHWACSNKNRECLKLLIEKEVSINIRDNEGMSPSMWACRMDHIDHFELLSQVTHQQIDEEDGLERDNNGRTWMHWSVRRMDPLECLKTLLTEEAAELQDTEGKSVMHVAAEQGSLPASKIILEIAGKPCLDHRDNTNRTPLMLATMGGHGEVVNYLLAEGSDLACVDDFGATAWDYARARQLHYCMLIIASYIREQAKNRPESQQGDDGDNARYPGLPDDNLGINSLQINGGGGDAEEQVYYGHHKPAPPPRVPEAPTTPRTPRAAIPSSRTPRSNGNGQRNNGFVSPAPPGSPQRNQPQPGSPSRNQAMKRSPSGQRDEEDEGMYDESHVREGSAEKRRRANDDGPQREMTLMSVNSYDLDAPDGPVPNHHDPPEHEEEMQNDSKAISLEVSQYESYSEEETLAKSNDNSTFKKKSKSNNLKQMSMHNMNNEIGAGYVPLESSQEVEEILSEEETKAKPSRLNFAQNNKWCDDENGQRPSAQKQPNSSKKEKNVHFQNCDNKISGAHAPPNSPTIAQSGSLQLSKTKQTKASSRLKTKKNQDFKPVIDQTSEQDSENESPSPKYKSALKYSPSKTSNKLKTNKNQDFRPVEPDSEQDSDNESPRPKYKSASYSEQSPKKSGKNLKGASRKQRLKEVKYYSSGESEVIESDSATECVSYVSSPEHRRSKTYIKQRRSLESPSNVSVSRHDATESDTPSAFKPVPKKAISSKHLSEKSKSKSIDVAKAKHVIKGKTREENSEVLRKQYYIENEEADSMAEDEAEPKYSSDSVEERSPPSRGKVAKNAKVKSKRANTLTH